MSPQNQGQLECTGHQDQQPTEQGQQDEFAGTHECPLSDSVSVELDRQYGVRIAYSGGVTFSLRPLALALALALFGAACAGASDTTDTGSDAGAAGATDSGADSSDDTGSSAVDDEPADAPATDGTDAAPPAAEGDDEMAATWEHDWTGDLIGGGQLDANSLVGQDLVLWFWAPW